MSQSSSSIESPPSKANAALENASLEGQRLGSLPASPSLVFLKRQARDLRSDFKSGELHACSRVQAILDQRPARLTQSRALLIVAREHGFSSWPSLKAYVDSLNEVTDTRSLHAVENIMKKQIGHDRSIEDLSGEVRELLDSHRSAATDGLMRIRNFHPEHQSSADDVIAASAFDENAAQLVLAREYGFATWQQLTVYISPGAEVPFESLACLTYGTSDRPSNWQRAADMLQVNPDLASTDIWTAACAGNADTVRQLLADDPTLLDQRGGYFDWEPLLYACYSRLDEGSTLEVARVLIEAGANPNAHYMWAGQYRFTALTGAFGEGEMGPVNQPEHRDCQALAKLLLQAGAHPNDSQALYNRMFTEGSKVLELLLKYGLAANDRNNWLLEEDGQLIEHPEETLFYQLRYALKNHHVGRAKLLIDHGTKLDDDPDTGQSLYEIAVLRGHPDLADYLVDFGARKPDLTAVDRLASALAAGDERAARTLLQTDPDLVRKTEEKYPSLVIDAAASNQLDAVRAMANVGLSVNRLTHRAPLHEAAWSNHLKMVQLLIGCGADTGARDQHYAATPLQFAQTAGNPDIAAFIATCEIDVFDAVACNNEERLRALVSADTDLLEARFRLFRTDTEAHPLDWMTPLAFAATRGQSDMVDVLLSLGANLAVSTENNIRLIDVLKDQGSTDMANKIEQAGGAA